jgi:hypothetical protein
MGRLGGQAFGGEKVVTPEALYSEVMHLAGPAWGRARGNAGVLAVEGLGHGGLTPRAVLEKFAAIQMFDGHLPTTDGREIVMSRYTQPAKDLCLLLDQMNLTLPEQASPKIYRPDSNLN